MWVCRLARALEIAMKSMSRAMLIRNILTNCQLISLHVYIEER